MKKRNVLAIALMILLTAPGTGPAFAADPGARPVAGAKKAKKPLTELEKKDLEIKQLKTQVTQLQKQVTDSQKQITALTQTTQNLQQQLTQIRAIESGEVVPSVNRVNQVERPRQDGMTQHGYQLGN